MAKMIVALMRDRPVPGKSDLIGVPLEKRVQYAIDCIDSDTPEASQAREFLHKVRDQIADEKLGKLVDNTLTGESNGVTE